MQGLAAAGGCRRLAVASLMQGLAAAGEREEAGSSFPNVRSSSSKTSLL